MRFTTIVIRRPRRQRLRESANSGRTGFSCKQMFVGQTRFAGCLIGFGPSSPVSIFLLVTRDQKRLRSTNLRWRPVWRSGKPLWIRTPKHFLVAVREAVPLMSKGGRILAITFAPGGRFGSWQPWVAMGAAKAAMEVLVRYFAVALARSGITVNTISPGWVEDSVLNSLPEAFQTGLRDWQERGWTPMGRLGTPADIGKAVALICSEEAEWITGQLIDVDGGASLVDAHLPLEFQGIPKAKDAEAA